MDNARNRPARRGLEAPPRRRWSAALLTLGMALAWTTFAAAARAQGTDTLPDDEALDRAAEAQQVGHAWQAEALLRRLAEAGNVTAMERLALLHWYGPRLHPAEPWSTDTARLWFVRAAARGSHLARHMLRVTCVRAASCPSVEPKEAP